MMGLFCRFQLVGFSLPLILLFHVLLVLSAPLSENSTALLFHQRRSDTINSYCRSPQTDPGWYRGSSTALNPQDCKDAIQQLSNTDAVGKGFRNLLFSPLNNQNIHHESIPRFYQAPSGTCVLAIVMRHTFIGRTDDKDRYTVADAYPQGSEHSDVISYRGLVNEAEQVFYECVYGGSHSAGWKVAGQSNSLAVLFWERYSAWDNWARWLDGAMIRRPTFGDGNFS
ncbi:MAG: hypothetical protein Q9190_004543 [Brigantiaea leucoxantha]